MNSSTLQKATEAHTSGFRLSTAPTSGLPADIVQGASKRLAWASLAYAITFALAYFVLTPRQETDTWFLTLGSLVSLISIIIALGVFIVARYGRMRPEHLLDLGLIWEVFAVLGISLAGGGLLNGLPWECVWILVFPLLVPNTPGKTLLAALAAASTGLLNAFLWKLGVRVTDTLLLTEYADFTCCRLRSASSPQPICAPA